MRKFCFVLALCVVVLCVFSSCGKSVTQNYGLSGVTMNAVDKDGNPFVFRAEDVVPERARLVEALRAAGFSVTEYDASPDKTVSADRIYAEKGRCFLDICYGLTEETVEAVFAQYEKIYPDFYLLARNQRFVYCVSDKSTFKKAGFASTANDGVQYICE